MFDNSLKTVVVAGASGLVGGKLMELLCENVTVKKIIVLSRRPLEFENPRVQVIVTDFTHLLSVQDKVKGADVIYCCIGTTIKKARSRVSFRNVDYQIPYDLAALASRAGIPKLIIVSSIGANPSSKNFYLRVKGEMERDIAADFRFQKLAFLRPSLLVGDRREFRFGERLMQLLMSLFSFAFVGRFSRFRPVTDHTVAKAMVSISNSVNNQKVYESVELPWLGS